jgi:hypothetical protein
MPRWDDIHPVYVDGPLKGQDFPVGVACRYVNAAVSPLSPVVATRFAQEQDRGPTMEMVTYEVRRFALRGDDGDTFSIWVACLAEPTAAELAEAILNDAAKAAKVDI